MKIKNGLANLISGIIRQIVLLILGLVLPRLILVTYGSEVNGFMSSVSQLITYLALLEVGVGTATLQALYKPLSKGNKAEINSIMAATHAYYKRTGFIYAILVLIVSFIYPIIVKTSISKFTIILFVLLTGMTGVLNYFYQGKYKILLQAEGKNYIETNLATISAILINLSKIILIYFKVNIIFLQLVFVLFNILQILFIKFYINQRYEWLDLNSKRNYEAISQRKSVMLHEISYMIFSYTDTAILTFMCDLKTVSVYTVYTMIFGQVESVINIFISSIQHILGQIYSVSIEKYKKFYDLFEMFVLIIAYTLFTVAYLLINPFLKLYTSGINDTNYLLPLLPFLYIIIKLFTVIRTITNQTITVGGYFTSTRRIALIEAIINLSSTLLFVSFLGIYGVLLGTIFGLLFRVISTYIYIDKKILGRSLMIPIKRLFVNTVVLFVIKSFMGHYFDYITNYLELIIAGGFAIFITGIVYLLVSLITDYSVFKEIVLLLEEKKYILKIDCKFKYLFKK